MTMNNVLRLIMQMKQFLHPVASSPIDYPVNEKPYIVVEYSVGEKVNSGTLVFELFWKEAPKASRNFYEFLVGTEIDGKQYKYENCPFHMVKSNFGMQGGDVLKRNGTGFISIYGGALFKSEDSGMGHDRPGRVSMINMGSHGNGSQFFITFSPQQSLDRDHVVFAQVTEGLSVIDDINKNVITDSGGRPVSLVKITKSGSLKDGEKVEEKEL